MILGRNSDYICPFCYIGNAGNCYILANVKICVWGSIEALMQAFVWSSGDKSMKDKPATIVLDLFSGAGGLSEGFFRAGYKFISHIEMDKYASMTLETRAVYHTLKENGMENCYYDYIAGEISRESLLKTAGKFCDMGSGGIITSEISQENEEAIIGEIKKRMKEQNIKNVDVIIGGPPCQAYSPAGISRASEKMKNDPRNYLYLHYLSFIRSFMPEIFVFENVPGIRTARNGQIFHDFLIKADKLGYTVEEKNLDATDFNVLQKRKRIIIIGWKSHHKLKYPSFVPEKSSYKISDLLDDLPPLEPGEGTNDPQPYRREPGNYLRESGIRSDKDVLTQHIARTHNDSDREIYRRVISTWDSERRRLKYNELPEKLKTQKNPS